MLMNMIDKNVEKKKNSVPIFFFHTVIVGGLINVFLSKLSKRYQQNYQLSTTLFKPSHGKTNNLHRRKPRS